jgi:hypothetical protein
LADYLIALAQQIDIRHLQHVERSAGRMFAEIGMPEIADHEPTGVETFEDRFRHGRLYIAALADGGPAGFLYWSMMDGFAYIEEVSVGAEHRGNRLGARMIERLARDVAQLTDAITLATFRHVPWNAPYYARLGFVECNVSDLGTDHVQAWQDQQADGLDMSRRLFMKKPLGPPDSGQR